jgi:hypothetical protein
MIDSQLLYYTFFPLSLGGQSLWGDKDTKDVLDWLKGLAANFCDEGIQKLVPRCDRCRNLHGDYVEK